ncbi:MAG: hypothetical protein KGD57_07590 [Candidatus Lokiarchaeota archaeon]|nr:hypothetical protein [Candidatus Lokiarchaeota archaeon]
MYEYEKSQKVIEIHNTKIGGNIGENPIVAIGTVFYSKHKALLNEKTGEINKQLLEKELNEYTEIIDDMGLQAIIDVVGTHPEALLKECLYIAELTDFPFLVDGLNDNIRIPAIQGLKEAGLLNRAILNSIDENTSEESLEKFKDIGIKNAVLLTFGSRFIFPNQKIILLKETLIPKAEKANIKNFIIDTAVLDLPSMGINYETVRLVKTELGLPAGYAPSNAIFGWNKVKKYGDKTRCGAIASIMVNCVNAGSDFVLFGPIKFAKCVIPSIALISGINSYYRKRVLRKDITNKDFLKKVF